MLRKSLQKITSEVIFPSQSMTCIISIVYASNDDDRRKELWEELSYLKWDPRILSKLWIILGNFNQTLDSKEHSRPVSLNVDAKTRLFREVLLDADLADLNFRGPTFTSTNKSKTNLIAKKLDRVLVNEDWLNLMSSSYAIFGEPDFSDHIVCGVVFQQDSIRAKRPIRFHNYLLQNESFF